MLFWWHVGCDNHNPVLSESSKLTTQAPIQRLLSSGTKLNVLLLTGATILLIYTLQKLLLFYNFFLGAIVLLEAHTAMILV